MRTLAADTILAAHLALATFIVLGLVCIYVGGVLNWQWIRNFWVRIAHAAAICIVAAEAILGVTCPLTLWEDALRYSVGQPSFVARWMRRLLYYDLPDWVFTSAYVACAGATLFAWRLFPPRGRPR
jgi:hypothetical protein